MNLNRILSMIVNAVVRRVVNRGVAAGMTFAERKLQADHRTTPDAGQGARAAAKRARKAAQITRRLGR